MGVLKVKTGGVWVPVAQGVGISSPGLVGYAIGGATTSILATVVDMVGASVTFVANPLRTYKTTVLTARLDQAAATGNVWVQLTDAANSNKGSGNQSITLTNGGYGFVSVVAVESGLSGTQVRKARIRTDAGSCTAQAGTLVLVEDITTATMDGIVAPWVPVTFQNSWANFGSGYQTCQYRLVGDTVQLRGVMAGGAGNTVAFTLPVGFRPPQVIELVCQSNNVFSKESIATNGAVTPVGGPNFWINSQFSITA